MRGRSPYYSPRRGYDSPPRRGYDSPPRRSYGGRRRSPSPPPRGGRGGYGREPEPPTSLLVRNIPRDCTADDLRIPFERYGVVKDVYLPRDYYTGLPRGFGFVQFLEPRDAAEAQYCLDHQLIAGREITVVFAEENRKKPQEMRIKERIRGRPGFGGRRGSRSRSPRRFSPSPRGGRRSRSPSRTGRGHRRRSYTPSPGYHGNAPSRSPSPVKSHRRTRDRTPDSSKRSPSPPSRSRDPQARANGRDQYGSRSRSPGSSPSVPPRRRRSPSPRQYSPDERRLQEADM
ncbi:serine/arginine-rich SC35-like splicing factor SCL30A isoform X2 [Physcomitrium patens]|uniref:Arginine/serine-rich splicing factor SCL33 transcript I n=1 Tax=Physcomitrium patens TaxID=3218 RepID=M1H5B0_PHYPA|nr:serine/arginine-rich SC35-like splicing factor SCL30A isoform X2 [Physcomitrium patens]AGE46173.1 arginine/serine-rich splicing factor SCL33 transcript I [Physcomitrium patens]PNR52338.1 hypothetical protein PHYPA_008712 [Physcomitrium patens]|eukprot:XP_024377232.1 serine/arginine-rich SC35-like splicing factor SCL30A isoform X2 [Physcomitrella patens]